MDGLPSSRLARDSARHEFKKRAVSKCNKKRTQERAKELQAQVESLAKKQSLNDCQYESTSGDDIAFRLSNTTLGTQARMILLLKHELMRVMDQQRGLLDLVADLQNENNLLRRAVSLEYGGNLPEDLSISKAEKGTSNCSFYVNLSNLGSEQESSASKSENSDLEHCFTQDHSISIQGTELRSASFDSSDSAAMHLVESGSTSSVTRTSRLEASNTASTAVEQGTESNSIISADDILDNLLSSPSINGEVLNSPFITDVEGQMKHQDSKVCSGWDVSTRHASSKPMISEARDT